LADNQAVYTVVVTNSQGNLTSGAATLTVEAAPVITSQPGHQSVNLGQTATFTVVATGNPAPTFQWKKDGVDVSSGTGGTTASYTTPATTLADNGAAYTVVVTNSRGTVTGGPAHLTVTVVPPSITVQPGSTTVSPGQTATFQVSADGSAPLGYQWLKNGSPIAGATQSSYTTPPTLLTENGTLFACRVSNAAGQVTSTSATLGVESLPPQPTSQLVSVSGRLSDASGNPLGAGTPAQRDMVIHLYTAPTGGTPVHSESFLASNGQAVAVQDGFFVVRLGEGAASQKALDVMAVQPDLYAEFQVGTGGTAETLSPRIPVTAPAYGGAPNFKTGTGVPSGAAKVGAVYQNLTDNSLWFRTPATWVRMSN
jgi:hypothetical protein